MKSAIWMLLALGMSNICWAEESCSEARKVNGMLTFVDVPCSSMEHAMPCSKEEVVNGSTYITDIPCPPGKRKTIEQLQREEDAAKKRKCGRDYNALRVGMTLARIEQCYEEPAFVTETTGSGGVVETYRGSFYFINVKNGRIVSYTRRTH